MHTLTLQTTLGALLQPAEILARRCGGGEGDALRKTLTGFSMALPGPGEGQDSPAHILQAAARLAAAPEGESLTDKHLPMRPIFTHLRGEHPGYCLPPSTGTGVPMPTKKEGPISGAQYDAIARQLCTGLSAVEASEAWISPIMDLLEDQLGALPREDARDLSLYDQGKLTAAFAACISEYLLHRGETDFSRLHGQAFQAEQAFLLYSSDFSGIQNFIFTVHTSGALASMRSRSFFLELLMEHYIDQLLDACRLSRANLLYSGGGHCYLLLPNTSAVTEALQCWNERFNQWLLKEFSAQLFLAHGWTPCCGNDLTNTPATDAPYTAMFRRVSGAIAAHKLRRYSPAQLRLLNAPENGDRERECKVCGRSDHLTSDDHCRWCDLFVKLSPEILSKTVYLVSREPGQHSITLPGWEDSAYISLINKETAHTRLKNGEAVTRIYTKNRTIPGLPRAVRLHVGDYAYANSMEALASESQGIRRLAVCRMDVDNLGAAFVSGYRVPNETAPEKRDRYLTIARTAAFSRQMSLFFKRYINPVLKEPDTAGNQLPVALVYSGGDDVFLVGSWSGVITAAERIRERFHKFCCGSLTISAGISIHHDHFPIRQAAAHSAELEDRAKNAPGKDTLALFDPEADHVYPWAVFRKKVMEEKLSVLQAFFESEEQERGNAFLYQLLELLRHAQEDKINLARFAYVLARMTPRDKSRQVAYKKFADAMYGWALSREDRQQLITAIYLFVYSERKGN